MKHRSFSIFGREELLEFPRVQFFDWSQLGMLCGSVDRKGIGAEKGPLHERRFELSCNWNWGRPPSQDFEAVLQSQSRGWGAKISNNVCSKIADLCRRRRHHRWTCLSTFFSLSLLFPFHTLEQSDSSCSLAPPSQMKKSIFYLRNPSEKWIRLSPNLSFSLSLSFNFTHFCQSVCQSSQ